MSDTNLEPTLSPADIVEAIRSATMEVFTTMLSMTPEPGETLTEKSKACAPASGIVSLVGLAGTWSGTGSLACTGALACKLASSLLMAEYTSMDDDVLDAVGEISNMIIGNVKTILEEKIGSMGLSTPTVIFGRNVQTRSSRNHEWLVVPFAMEGGNLFVQMSIAPNREGDRTTLRAGFQMPQVLSF
jgi:chemotaxis protein CheX